MKNSAALDTNPGTWIGAAIFAIGYFVVMFYFDSGVLRAGYHIALLFGFVIAIAVGAEIGKAIWSALYKDRKGDRRFKLKK